MKEMAPNHLVAIGEEGFYARGFANPGGASSCATRPRQAPASVLLCMTPQQQGAKAAWQLAHMHHAVSADTSCMWCKQFWNTCMWLNKPGS